MGQKIKDIPLDLFINSTNTVSLSLDELLSGVYFLRIIKNEKKMFLPFIIEK